MNGLWLALAAEFAGDWLIEASEIEGVLEQLASLAPRWTYIVLAAGVAIENFFPPVPADTFVVFGAFLSVEGRVTGLGVFLITWPVNTASALLNYGLARRWGRGLLGTRPGRWILRPRQLERLAGLYNAHGSKIIFASRFLPAFRVLVPVFAGISHLAFWRTAVPLAAASAIWYGVLVYAGAMLGRNWRVLLPALNEVNTLLLVVATVLAVFLVVVWWRTRHHAPDAVSGEGGRP
ncbi:MAG: DedA family protein [Gemmatimonadota bacterium]|nr:MAG: DedA family protein [Gemmatimonadota bacterium]